MWLISACTYGGIWKGGMHLVKNMHLWSIAMTTSSRTCWLSVYVHVHICVSYMYLAPEC